uniref:JmjC domain-containing protein n=1 Tax=Entomoneis paludosa TaxID=265537 RepID=A0A7S2Y860_9STRA
MCALDWHRDSYETIQAYRRAEIPFVLQNHPTVMATTERWNTPLTSSTDQTKTEPYLVELLRNEPPQRNEYAKQSNHMPFWRILNPDEVDPHFVPPTQNVALTLPEWWQHAQHLEEALAHNQTTVTTSDHYYFRLAATLTHGPEPVHAFLYDELPMFHPSYHENDEKGDLDQEEDASTTTTHHHDPLFMVDPSQERGINCRFGMVGNVADNHFDPTRNWIVVLGGRRRYILSPPSQCRHLNLHPLGHVSARHSADDWSQTSTSKAAQDHLQHAQALQILLQPGDALYLPTSWFHFIVSLTTSFQCNARSGSTQTRGSKLQAIFEECGFPNLYV